MIGALALFAVLVSVSSLFILSEKMKPAEIALPAEMEPPTEMTPPACKSASTFDPLSASNFDPLQYNVLH